MLLRSYSFKQHQKGVFAMTCQVKQRHQNSSVISNARGSSYPPIYAKKWEKKIVVKHRKVTWNSANNLIYGRDFLHNVSHGIHLIHGIWRGVIRHLFRTLLFHFPNERLQHHFGSSVCVCVCLFALSSLWWDMNFVFFFARKEQITAWNLAIANHIATTCSRKMCVWPIWKTKWINSPSPTIPF